MRRLRLPRLLGFLAAAGALAVALLPARSLGAEEVSPSWVAQVPFEVPGNPATILAAGALFDGSVLTVLGNMDGLRAVRVSASGELLGMARFWAPSIRYTGVVYAVVEPGGDVVVGGEGRTERGDFWLMRFDGRTGAWRWRSPVVWGAYDGRLQWIRALRLDGDGNVLVTGAAEGEKTDAATMKLDGATGEVLWGPVVFDTGGDDGPRALSVDKAGNVAVLGTSGMDPDGHLFAVQYNGASGAEAWRFEWKGARAARAAIRLGDGGLVGSAAPAAGSGTALVALSPEGTLRWSRVLDAPDSTSRLAPLALAPGKGRDGEAFFVAGVSGTDQVLWKLSAGNGWRIWGPVPRPGTAGSTQHQPAIATTPEGDLLVIQSESDGGSWKQTHASSVRGSNGRPGWGPLVIPDRQTGYFQSVVTDALGNPFVIAGDALPRDSPPLLTIAHVSRIDGSFLSGPVELPGDIPGEASPQTVLVDGRGDVVSLVTTPNYGPATRVAAKVEGGRGRLLWGPVPIASPSFDSARIGLEPSGDVFWAGPVDTQLVYGRLRGDTGLAAWGPIPYGAAYTRLAGLAVLGSDLALLATTTTAEGSALQVLRVRGDTGALAYPPVTVSHSTGSTSPGSERLVYRAGVLAVCAGEAALLDASTGAIRWGPFDAREGPCALDDSGNLFLQASDWAPEPGTWLQKRAGADGSVLWSTFLSGVDVRGIAADAAGDVAVASTTSGWPPRLDVRKLAGATGTPVWGPVGWGDPASVTSTGDKVAITPSGDVVVLGGTSDVTATNALVLRLSGASGELLGSPLLFGGGSETYPRGLGLSGELPVIGVASSVLGAAVVSWQQRPVPFVDRTSRRQ